MNRIKKRALTALIGAAVISLVITSVAASPKISGNTPLYAFRMEQASSEMSFLPKEKTTFVYTTERGYTLNYDTAEACNVWGSNNGREPPTAHLSCFSPTCLDTCVMYRSTCANTCDFTCWGTCDLTCRDSTCQYTCQYTCKFTCWNTCISPTCYLTCTKYTCWGTCNSTCWGTCQYTCQYTCKCTFWPACTHPWE